MMLRDKIAVVTGASSGIGRATAVLMAREGAAVVLSDIDAKAGEAAAQEIRSAGGRAVFQVTDVTDERAVAALVERAEKEYGGLDLAYNNAGIEGAQAPLHEQDMTGVRRAFDVLITSVFLCMRHEIPALQRRGGGAIVNCSSMWGLNAWPNWSPYITSKHAVSGMTKTAALEQAPNNIRINAVAPGPILTPLLLRGWRGDPSNASGRVPMGRIGRPEEVAEAVVWLLSERASFVNGHVLPVDGGMMAQTG
jgi:NAD(P)-dependent dehydrogenase (short-subunit alcohol dehydrogenase family)